MLKRFLDGLIFGSGFGIALVAIWLIGTSYLLPRLISPPTMTSEPEFENPIEPELAEPDPERKEFQFFKHSGERMQIPEGGGILAMSPMGTPRGAKRPSTYQLWLTESQLWQIRTTEEKVELEALPYPKNASVNDLDKLMFEKLGPDSRQSIMTVSAGDINQLRTSHNSYRDTSMNGRMRITVEGVVFVMPNPYEG